MAILVSYFMLVCCSTVHGLQYATTMVSVAQTKRTDTVLESRLVHSERHCTMLCLNRARCSSANTRSTSAGVVCELLENTSAGEEVTDPDSTHYKMREVCSSESCYSFINLQCAQADCQRHCRQQDNASKLLIIDSEEEADFLRDLAEMFPEFAPDGYVRMGIQEITGQIPGTWQDESGSAVSYTSWREGEPNDPSQLCAVVNLREKAWRDVWCHELWVAWISCERQI